MFSHLDSIKRLITEMETDFPKFYQQKNQSAGLRIRRNMQQVRELAQQVRLDVLAQSKRRAGTKRRSRPSR